MSIEFIGLPGVGKSWLCTSLAGSLGGEDANREGIPDACSFKVFPPVDTQPRFKVFALKVMRASYFSLLHPVRTWQLLNLVRRSGQSSPREALAKTVNLLAELGKGKWRHRAYPIFEQGVLQAIWSLALRARHTNLPAFLAVAKPFLPMAVIHVETERGELLRRLENRENGRSRLDRLSRDRRVSAILRGEKLFLEIVEEWSRILPRPLYLKHQNSSCDDPEAALTAIIGAVVSSPDREVG